MAEPPQITPAPATPLEPPPKGSSRCSSGVKSLWAGRCLSDTSPGTSDGGSRWPGEQSGTAKGPCSYRYVHSHIGLLLDPTPKRRGPGLNRRARYKPVHLHIEPVPKGHGRVPEYDERRLRRYVTALTRSPVVVVAGIFATISPSTLPKWIADRRASASSPCAIIGTTPCIIPFIAMASRSRCRWSTAVLKDRGSQQRIKDAARPTPPHPYEDTSSFPPSLPCPHPVASQPSAAAGASSPALPAWRLWAG